MESRPLWSTLHACGIVGPSCHEFSHLSFLSKATSASRTRLANFDEPPSLCFCAFYFTTPIPSAFTRFLEPFIFLQQVTGVHSSAHDPPSHVSLCSRVLNAECPRAFAAQPRLDNQAGSRQTATMASAITPEIMAEIIRFALPPPRPVVPSPPLVRANHLPDKAD